jgi:hypothetical protein
MPKHVPVHEMILTKLAIIGNGRDWLKLVVFG